MLFEKIPNNEVKMIETYIDRLAATPEMDATRIASVDYILREWDKAKSNYLKNLFGEHLILAKEVIFKKVEEQLFHEMEDIVYEDDSNYFLYRAFEKIGEDCVNYRLRYKINELLSWESLCSNVYNGETFELLLDNGKTLKINHGIKTIKALTKIAAAFNLDSDKMEHFRLCHSRILNQKELKGTLCLSIHPLDYMTMSDNNCDWSSCMSWIENGCYRQGTVEMMNSPMVVVAYLCASEDMNLFDGYWSNKKWRELYIVTPEMISNVKAYPYKNSILTKNVLDWLKELATNANLGEYDKDIITWDMEERFEREGKCYTIIPYTDNMYNDFAEGQLAYFGRAINKYADEVYEFNYSGASECMLCGELDPEFTNEGCVVGLCCDDPTYCDCCGDRVSEDELVELDGMWVCQDCYNNHACYDDITGDLRYDDNLIAVSLVSEDCLYAYPRVHIRTDVNNLFNKILMNEYIKGPVFGGQIHWYRRDYLINITQLTQKGIELFECDTFEELKHDIESTRFHFYPISDEVRLEMKEFISKNKNDLLFFKKEKTAN